MASENERAFAKSGKKLYTFNEAYQALLAGKRAGIAGGYLMQIKNGELFYRKKNGDLNHANLFLRTITEKEWIIEEPETMLNSFTKVVEPVIKWLNDNATPHSKIIIETDRAELVGGEMAHVTDKFIKD